MTVNYELLKDQLTPTEIAELNAAEVRYCTYLRNVRTSKIWEYPPYHDIFQYFDAYQRDRAQEKLDGKPINTRQPEALRHWNKHQRMLTTNKKKRKIAREAKKMLTLSAGLGKIQQTETPGSTVGGF